MWVPDAEAWQIIVGLMALGGIFWFVYELVRVPPYSYPDLPALFEDRRRPQSTPVEGAESVSAFAQAAAHSNAYSQMKRAVGYCSQTECEDHLKGVFLLNHGDTFYCPRCRQLGFVEAERSAVNNGGNFVKEVRVEYNFDPNQKRYRELAIVRDDSVWGRGNTYTLYSPLIKTERRALKVAESILANLQRIRGPIPDGAQPRSTEIILSFDDDREEFSRRLDGIIEALKDSGLSRIGKAAQEETQ